MSIVLSPSYSERCAAVAAADAETQAECTASVAALNDQIRACHDGAAARKAAGARAASARFDELDAALAADVLEALVPLARNYPDAPRSTAASIATKWRELNARAREELGTEIHPSHLAIAFAVAAGFEDRFGSADAFHYGGGTHPAAEASDEANHTILAGGHDALADAVIRKLETAVCAQAQNTPHADAERAAAKRSRATAAGMRAEEQRVDAKRAAARAAVPSVMSPGSRIWP